jgi:uncharacterized alpha-E superfamily protein
MLSRVADSLYWAARYMERADNLARLLLSTHELFLDAGAESSDEAQFWSPVLMTTGDEKSYATRHGDIQGHKVAEFLALDQDNPNSILNCIRAARENARTIRDQISDEVWGCINDLRLFVDSANGISAHRHQQATFYERVLRGSYQFQGIVTSTTPRGKGWHFLRLGACIERADATSRLIDTCSTLSHEVPPHPEAQPMRWAALLRSCSAWHAYQEFHNRLVPTKVLEYLLLEESFPRSVANSVAGLKKSLMSLCEYQSEDSMPEPVRLSGRLYADVVYSTIEEILKRGVHEFIDELQGRLNQIGQTIFETFVVYADLMPTVDETARLGIQPTAWNTPTSEDTQTQHQ